jgi:hypothetical protein
MKSNNFCFVQLCCVKQVYCVWDKPRGENWRGCVGFYIFGNCNLPVKEFIFRKNVSKHSIFFMCCRASIFRRDYISSCSRHSFGSTQLKMGPDSDNTQTHTITNTIETSRFPSFQIEIAIEQVLGIPSNTGIRYIPSRQP